MDKASQRLPSTLSRNGGIDYIQPGVEFHSTADDAEKFTT